MSADGGFGTGGAETMDFQSVAGHTEPVLGGDFFEEGRDFFIAKFDELAAFFADEMIVLGVTVVVFVDFAVVCPGNFADESGIFEFANGAVDGCAADAATITAGLCESGNDLITVEVFVFGEDFANDGFAFLSEPLAARGEEFAEFLERRDRDGVRRKSGSGGVCHRRPLVQ
jgi:hypothetical protein